MEKYINKRHKYFYISNNYTSARSRKKIYSSINTPKNSKNVIQKSKESPLINFGGILKSNSKSKNKIINQKKNKSIEKENHKVLKINNIQNCINTPMKVIKVISSPSITTLNNTIYNNNNSINNNINKGMRKNKTSIDFSTQIIENEDSSFANKILFQLINTNKNKNENNKRKNNDYNNNYSIINNNEDIDIIN